MIVRTPDGHDVELRADMFGGASSIPQPSIGTLAANVAGVRVSPDSAAGLPAILSGIRVIAETVAGFPCVTYRGADSARAAAPDATQYDVLAKAPNDLQTPVAFFSYLVASMHRGNAYALKMFRPGTRQVVGLWPLPPQRVTPKHDGGSLKFEVQTRGGAVTTLTSRELIHMPGVLWEDPFIGVSPIAVHANAVGLALGTEEYAGRFYANDATPAGALTLPMEKNSTQARELREFWEDRHRGGKNAHKLAVLFGGASYTQIGVNAQEAQIIEAQKWSVEQAARVLRLPPWVLGVPEQSRMTPEQKNLELLALSIMPWCNRVAQALNRDADLFPEGSGLSCSFNTDSILAADMMARYGAYTLGRQAGWLNVDTIRGKEHLPPLENGAGQHYLETPVGGAPNLQPGEKPKPDPVSEEKP